MLAHEAFGEFGVAGLQGLDDRHVFLDGVGGAVALPHRRVADAAHVHEQVAGDVANHLALAEGDDLLVEADVGVEYSSRWSDGRPS